MLSAVDTLKRAARGRFIEIMLVIFVCSFFSFGIYLIIHSRSRTKLSFVSTDRASYNGIQPLELVISHTFISE